MTPEERARAVVLALDGLSFASATDAPVIAQAIAGAIRDAVEAEASRVLAAIVEEASGYTDDGQLWTLAFAAEAVSGRPWRPRSESGIEEANP